jgi:Cys-tRNA(Pro) deacylase
MSRPDIPVTPAVRFLRDAHVPFEPFLYRYEEHGGTARAAAVLGVDEGTVIKTLIMETEQHRPLVVLMPGNREVSTKQLARVLGVKSVKPCDPATASRHTGYLIGGTSPFGLRNPLPVYGEAMIFRLPRIYLNGGKRGFLIALNPQDLRTVLHITEVTVAAGGPASARL